MVYVRFLYSTGSTPHPAISCICYFHIVYFSLFLSPVFVNDFLVPRQWLPASTQGWWRLFPAGHLAGEGTKASTCLIQPKQRLLLQSSSLHLKMQVCQRMKGKGWGLFIYGFWAKSNRAVLDQVRTRYGESMLQEWGHHLMSLYVLFHFSKVMCEALCLV